MIKLFTTLTLGVLMAGPASSNPPTLSASTQRASA